VKLYKSTSHNLIICLCLGLFFCAAIFVGGCKEATMSNSQQLEAFDLAGPITPRVDIDQLLSAKNNTGIYTVGIDDVLELQIPTILTAIAPNRYKDQQSQIEPYLCRIADDGSITLPITGKINIDGKTLARIEDEIVNLYHPKYLVTRPSVVCSVKEYHITNVTVVGAVEKPGVYQFRSNEMSLVNALMKAGGIVQDGASLITIKNPQRKYISKSDNSVKQFAEFAAEVNQQYIEYLETPKQEIQTPGTEADFSALQVDLAFRPQDGSATVGDLVIQRGSEKLYSKVIDIGNSSQRAEYVQNLQHVIGTEQGYIVGQAIEQLASQLVPTPTTAVTPVPPTPATSASPTVRFNNSDNELVDAANEIDERIETLEPNAKKGCSTCGQKKYIETPAKTETQSEVKFEPVKVETVQAEVKAEPVTEIPQVETELIADENQNEYITLPQMQSEEQPAKSGAVVEPIVLPVKGLNIPFADVSLMEGDLIEVKRLNPSVFTVIGLAKSPGAFPYPPEVQYNLMEAIGFAGGIDIIADPRFVSIYRQDAKGEVVTATVRIDKKFMAKSYNVKIKPGDVISIDVTPRTKMNTLLHQMLRINFGVYVNPNLGNN
jgi:protein involved in polysaccharide export with SLBB domain